MILTDQKRCEAYVEAGLWGHATLDGLLRKTAAASPHKAILTDAENRPNWPRSFEREFSAQMLDEKVSALASRLMDLGIKQDDRIAIYLPNTVEAVISVLAAMRAGAIAIPVPFAWRKFEIVQGFQRVNPTAIITTAAFDSIKPAEIACQAAFETFSLRYILSFGEDLPDGVSGLDDCLGDFAPTQGDEAMPRVGNAADHIAAMFFRSGDPARPVGFSHNQLIASATQVSVAARMASEATVLNTIGTTCLAGFSFGVAPMLALGAKQVLSVPFHMRSFISDLGQEAISHLVLPGVISSSSRILGAFPERFSGRLVRYWSDPVQAASVAMPGEQRAIDVVNLDDIALTVSDVAATIGCVSFGKTRVGDHRKGPVALEARLKGGPIQAADASPSLLRGELELSGPVCPSATVGGKGELMPLSDGSYIGTSLRGGFVDNAGQLLSCTGRHGEFYRVGGIMVSAKMIDTLFQSFDGVADAAVYPEADPVFGTKFQAALVPKSGQEFSVNAFRTYLAEAGLAEYCVPERIIVVDSIPRGEGGLVLRRQIALAA